MKMTPFERCEKIAEQLNEKYPTSQIKFDSNGKNEPEKLWSFFTQVDDRHKWGIDDKFVFGSEKTRDLEKLANKAEKQLELEIRRNLDPAVDLKYQHQDWHEASKKQKETFPGAAYQKFFGGVDGEPMIPAIITKQGKNNFGAFLNGEKLTVPMPNAMAAVEALDAKYEGLFAKPKLEPKPHADLEEKEVSMPRKRRMPSP